MPYRPNPKTEGSGILCCIPQSGRCPNGCPECFFQNGRSYLEPLADNLPNMPTQEQAQGRVVRMNDGHDSNVDREKVLAAAENYRDVFFNTAIPRLDFPVVVGRAYVNGVMTESTRQAPVVLTINPGRRCDEKFYTLDDCGCTVPPPNLMFLRLLVSPFNTELCRKAVDYWTGLGVPVVFTYMAYHKMPTRATVRFGQPCVEEAQGWVERKRTTNSYFAVEPNTWASVMHAYRANPLVYSCGESYSGTISCKQCGSCLREYFRVKCRLFNENV